MMYHTDIFRVGYLPTPPPTPNKKGLLYNILLNAYLLVLYLSL